MRHSEDLELSQQVQGFCMTTSEVAVAIGAEQFGEDITLKGVSTDTRTITAGALFIALRGPNFNGHDFIDTARQRSAAAVMVDYPCDDNGPALIVKDTWLALGQLSKVWRNKFSLPLIAVTGSNGKTTVKEMLASILRQQGETLVTQGNFNNDIGLPLTLLRMDQRHGHAVIEMGANHPGEIAYLTDLAKPSVAVITNAAAAHLEGFGSLEGVARAKGEIYQGLSDEGVAVINADDHYAPLWRELAAGKPVVSFGLNAVKDGQLPEVTATWRAIDTGCEISLTTPAGSSVLRLAVPGEHNVMNALAATAAALAVDVPLEMICAGLENFKPVSGRLELKAGVHGSRIIDDTYNANPASLHAALDVLQTYPGERFLALGDMAELGEDAEAMHTQAGIQARESGVDGLYTVGDMASAAAQAFGKTARSFNSKPPLIAALQSDLHKDATLLVKGSRQMQMEQVVAALTGGGC